MPREPSKFSQEKSIDDNMINTQGYIEHTSDSPTNLENQKISPIIIDDDDSIDTTRLQLIHHPAHMHEIIDVDAYDTDVEELNADSASFVERRQTRVKQETSPSIEIEILDDGFGWTSMGGQHIDPTEADHEMINTVPVPRASIFNADLGNSILGSRTRTAPLSQAVLSEASRKLAERFLRRPIAAGASSIFGGGIVPTSQSFAGPDENAEAASRFQQTREAYLRKKLLGEVTLEDEVLWGKAKADEEKRREQIEDGISHSRVVDVSDDEAAESENNLFLSQGRSRKRGHEQIIDDSEDDGGQANVTSRLRDVVDILGSEGEVNHRMKKKAPSKKKAANDRARDIDDARMAGLEEWVFSKRRNERKEGWKSKAGKQRGAPRKKKSKAARRSRQAPFGDVFDASSNIFDEANNNLNAAPAPIVSSRRKDKALKDMLIDIPLEDLGQARNEKENIIKSTRVLGKYGLCHLANDGTNSWVLKGMTSTLYNYQVQGAAWMKQREKGQVAPYGGILADHMGLGKTLQILACMVANRPEPGSDAKATLIVCTASIARQWEQEIQKHTQRGVFSIVLREGPGSRTSGMTGAHLVLQNADVVVTT